MLGSSSPQFVSVILEQDKHGLLGGFVAGRTNLVGRDHIDVSCSKACCGDRDGVLRKLHVDSPRAGFDNRTMIEAGAASSRLGGGTT